MKKIVGNNNMAEMVNEVRARLSPDASEEYKVNLSTLPMEVDNISASSNPMEENKVNLSTESMEVDKPNFSNDSVEEVKDSLSANPTEEIKESEFFAALNKSYREAERSKEENPKNIVDASTGPTLDNYENENRSISPVSLNSRNSDSTREERKSPLSQNRMASDATIELLNNFGV